MDSLSYQTGGGMRILQVVAVFPPATIYGGPSVVAAQQASSLAKRGHKVTVVASDVMELRPRKSVGCHATELNGAQVLYFRSRALHPPGFRGSRFPFVISRELSGWLRQCVPSFDAVHVHFAREWIPVRAAQVSIAYGVPTFLQPHGMLSRVGGTRGIIDQLWSKRLLESSTAVFALQQDESDEIRRIAPNACTVELPNGIDLPTNTEGWRASNLSDPIVLFLARLHPRKRATAFVEMARILYDDGVAARYRIVGPDGGSLAEAQRLVRRYKLDESVTFVGSLQGDAVAREYCNSAVYVFPAINEPFGMTVLEALSQGVPTVIANTCFISSALKGNGAAMVSDPRPEALAESVKAILFAPELAKRLSRAGRHLAKTQFTSDRVVERLETHYRMAYARAD